MSSLDDRLKELRKKFGTTQADVARACGMTERAYQRLEAGNKPNHDNLISLANYFSVSLDYLVGRSDNITK